MEKIKRIDKNILFIIGIPILIIIGGGILYIQDLMFNGSDAEIFGGLILSLFLTPVCLLSFGLAIIMCFFGLIPNLTLSILGKTHLSYSKKKKLSFIPSILLIFISISLIITSIVQKPFETYKNNSPTNICLIDQLSFDLNETPKKNLETAFKALRKDKREFKKKVPRVHLKEYFSSGSWIKFSDKDRSRCRYRIYYDGTIDYDKIKTEQTIDLSTDTYVCKSVDYWYYNNYESYSYECGESCSTLTNGFNVNLEYAFSEDTISRINIDFTVNDIENILGKIENRKLFEDTLKECIDKQSQIKTPVSNGSYGEPQYTSAEFKTSTGAIIVIEYGNCFRISGTYKHNYTTEHLEH
jgi:hypothetical protein